MNTFKWIIATVLLTGCLQTTKAEQPKEIQTVQAEQGPKAQLFSKPVLCAATLEEAVDLLSQVKKDGMKPLMYFVVIHSMVMDLNSCLICLFYLIRKMIRLR